MPRVTQYIREDDYEAWQAIPNKSEWIHKHLEDKEWQVNGKFITGNPDAAPNPFKSETIIKTPKQVAEIVKGISDTKFCSHGFAIGFCKHGCKK